MEPTSRRRCSRCTCKVSPTSHYPLYPALPPACPSHRRRLLFVPCAGVHAAVIVADLTDLRSFVDIGRWMTLFTAATSSPSSASLPFPVLLLANKADSPDRVLSDTSVAEWADKHRLTHSHVVSAKVGTGVEDAFRSIVWRVEKFVPTQPARVSRGSGSMDATQRLLSLLHSNAATRRSPSHSPSPSHRPSASLTPTSRTRASSLLSPYSLLSTLPPSTTPRLPPPSSSPRAAASGVARSHGYSHSALAVQRLTAGSHNKSPGISLTTLGRQETKERDASRSGSRVDEKEWVGERRQFTTASSAVTLVQSTKAPLTTIKAAAAAATAGDGASFRRPQPHSPSMREVDLRF